MISLLNQDKLAKLSVPLCVRREESSTDDLAIDRSAPLLPRRGVAAEHEGKKGECSILR